MATPTSCNILRVPKIFNAIFVQWICARRTVFFAGLRSSSSNPDPAAMNCSTRNTLLNMTYYSKLFQVGLSGSIHGELLTRSSNIYWRWDSLYKECSLYSGRMLRETEGIIDTSRTVRSSDLLEVKVIQLKKVNRVENTPMYYLETGTRRLQDQTCATPSLK